jgi:type II secretion system protein C
MLIKYAVTAVVCLFLLFQLANLTWLLILSDINVNADESLPNMNQPKVRFEFTEVDIAYLADSHLFGMPKRLDHEIKTPSIIQAPETKLNLKLRGLRKGQGRIQSSAIIEDSNGIQDIYYLGDEIKNHSNTTIHEIYSQSLILKRLGGFETLTLFEVLQNSQNKKIDIPEVTEKKIQKTKRPPLIDKTRNNQLTQQLVDIKNKIKTSPLSLSGMMVIEPIEENSGFKGYKVSSGSDKVLFARLGFVNGDVITQVNDVELDRPGKIMSMIGMLDSEVELEVKVSRRGQPLIFKYQLKE